MYPRFVVGTNGPFGKRQMEKRVILLIETYRLSCWPTGDLFPLAKATPRGVWIKYYGYDKVSILATTNYKTVN
jgi:hypothetical protein